MVTMCDQEFGQVIDISSWAVDDDYAQYPEGARDKTLYQCPTPAPFGFLSAGHRYLLKQSIPRAPHQFWMEAIAYEIGKIVGVQVPRALVATDGRTGYSGALIEWFYRVGGDVLYATGGNYMQRLVPNYDRKKGKQHNFCGIVLLGRGFSRAGFIHFPEWISEWAKVIVFDALIGNTDRHQDNWGVLWRLLPNGKPLAKLAPAFDNGTSLAYEVLDRNFFKFDDPVYFERYVARGRHHMRWQADDPERLSHFEFVARVAKEFPETRALMYRCVDFEMQRMKECFERLSRVDIPTKLSEERWNFLFRLIDSRRTRLHGILGEGA